MLKSPETAFPQDVVPIDDNISRLFDRKSVGEIYTGDRADGANISNCKIGFTVRLVGL